MHRLLRCFVTTALVAPLALLTAAPAGAGAGRYPIVLIHGWRGSGASFGPMIGALQAAGFTVVDFDPRRPGVQAMSYAPSSDGQHITALACRVVQPKIEAALRAAGYDPRQHIDVVAHSMGGLIARVLIERPGPGCDRDWAARVDDLVMLGTPNHGTWEGWVPSTIPAFGRWDATGADMRPGSAFLRRLGAAEPAGETYSCIGGDPPYGRFLRFDYDGDGVPHGFDGVVPAESPYVRGCTFDLVASNHGELLTQAAPLDDVINDLGGTGDVAGGTSRRLSGTASVRLEFARIGADHDPGTADENRFEVYLDPDGGNDGYRPLGTIGYDRDAPFTEDWGDHGPTAPHSITLPGTAGVLDVKVVAEESDPVSSDPIGTAYFRNITLSEDRDGQDYYQAVFPDAAGGARDTLRIAVDGVSAQPAG